MKYIAMLMTILLLSTQSVFASCGYELSPYDKEVSLPFENQPANNGQYGDGICFRYQLNDNNAKKIICKLSNFTEGWMIYSQNGTFADSYANCSFKGDVTLTLTHQENKTANNPYQFNVDETGSITFHHDSNQQLNATISCKYTAS